MQQAVFCSDLYFLLPPEYPDFESFQAAVEASPYGGQFYAFDQGYEAVQKNKPLVSNTMTVTGDCLPVQHNYEVRIGTPISYIIEKAGGLPEAAAKVISGGPMMGKAISNLDAATVKGTSGILILTEEQTRRAPETHCIRCGKCVGVCPIRLEPVFMYKYLMKGNWEAFRDQLHGMDCIECGACTYTCPARLPLTHAFRMGKQQVNNARMAAKAKAEAEKAQAAKKEA